MFAFLHGSFNEDEPFQDIDIAVYLSHDPEDTVEVILDLKDLLESRLDYAFEVDIQTLNDASLGFRFHSSRGTVLLCRDEEMLDEFRQITWLRYWDYEPFLRLSLQHLLEG